MITTSLTTQTLYQGANALFNIFSKRGSCFVLVTIVAILTAASCEGASASIANDTSVVPLRPILSNGRHLEHGKGSALYKHFNLMNETVPHGFAAYENISDALANLWRPPTGLGSYDPPLFREHLELIPFQNDLPTDVKLIEKSAFSEVDSWLNHSWISGYNAAHAELIDTTPHDMIDIMIERQMEVIRNIIEKEMEMIQMYTLHHAKLMKELLLENTWAAMHRSALS